MQAREEALAGWDLDENNAVDVIFHLSFLEGQVVEFYLEKVVDTYFAVSS